MTDTNLDTFLKTVLARELPQNPMARIKTLAKELAEGAAQDVWPLAIYLFRGGLITNQTELITYLEQRWNNVYPGLGLLLVNGYLEYDPSAKDTVLISRAAFALMTEAEPANIFISYRRKESSAFALLVLARLKMAGMNPFLDLALEPGEDWEQGLKERIKQHQYVIVLLGPSTLESEVCRQEIKWGIEYGLKIIPIWHNGFIYRSGEWDVALSIDRALSKTHTIRVIEESALGYNNAVIELLNRFGVTP